VQWTSHPPQEQEDPGSNLARVYIRFLEKHSSAAVYKKTYLISIICVLKGEIKTLATNIYFKKGHIVKTYVPTHVHILLNTCPCTCLRKKSLK
jgi:hypothetical protein